MAKVNRDQKLINTWWAQILMALVFLAVAYGSASLAIDSGNLFEYALTLFFLVLTIKTTIRVVRHRPTK